MDGLFYEIASHYHLEVVLFSILHYYLLSAINTPNDHSTQTLWQNVLILSNSFINQPL